MARSPVRRRLRRLATVLFVLLAAAVGVLWLGADLPRRWLERELARALDAEVRIGSLEFVSSRQFVLGDIVIWRLGWEPRVERVTIARLAVDASFRQALGNRFESLAADGVEVRLGAPTHEARPLPESDLRVKRVEIRRGAIVVAAEAGESRVDFEAQFEDWGGDLHGALQGSAATIDLGALHAIFGDVSSVLLGGTVEELRVDAFFGPSPAVVHVETTATRTRLKRGTQAVEFERVRLDAHVERDAAAGLLRVDARPELSGVGAAVVTAEFDAHSRSLRSGRVELDRVDLARFSSLLPPPFTGWTLGGTAAIEISTADGRDVDAVAELRIDELGGALPEVEEFHATAGDLRIEGHWRPAAGADGSDRLALAGQLRCSTLRATAGATALRLSGPDLQLTTDIDPRRGGGIEARLRVPSGTASHAGTAAPRETFPLELQLDGALALGDSTGIDGVLEIGSRLTGPATVTGRVALAPGVPFIDARVAFARLPPLEELRDVAAQFGVGLPDELIVTGVPRADFALAGPLADPTIRGSIAIAELQATLDDVTGARDGGVWRVEAAQAEGRVEQTSGSGKRWSLEQFALQGTLAHDAGSGPDVAPLPWSTTFDLSARGALDAVDGTLRLEDARLSSPLWAEVLFGAVQDGAGVWTARFALAAVELTRLRELSLLWIEDPAPEFSLVGEAGAELELRVAADRRFDGQGRLALRGAGFSSQDGSRVVEGAEGRVEVDLRSDASGEFAGEARGELTGPVLLWGTLFGDFSPLGSTIEASFASAERGWRSDFAWSLPDRVSARGHLAADGSNGTDFTLALEVPDLAAFLENYVKTPFEGSVDLIDTLRAAGELAVTLEGRNDDSLTRIAGNVETRDAAFLGVAGATTIGGLDLELPLDLEWHVDAEGRRVLADGVAREGSLQFDALSVQGVTLPAVSTRLASRADTILLEQPVELELFGGRVALEGVELAEWSRGSRHLGFALRLDELDLRTISESVGNLPLEGALNGYLPAVRLTQDQLEVDGGGDLQIFGGRVAIFDISGEEVLGRYPRVRFSADFEGVDLLDITRKFDFGEVYGEVEGQIRDCELFRGIPVRCNATMHSVETAGVPRKISVKAIRNISILGSGDRVGLLDRGLQRFFDTYNYSEIGMTMDLRNDRFLLRGTASRGDKELFVKGRLPFRIDIVNVAPGHAVSFQTMLERVKNLDVTTTPPARE